MTLLDDAPLAFDGDVTPVPAAARTVLPSQHLLPSAPQTRRTLSGFSRQDALLIGGALLSAASTTMLIFGRLTQLDGGVGFVVVGWVIFMVTYGALTALTESGPAVVDKLMTVVMTSCAVIAVSAVVSVIGFVLFRGRKALFHKNFFTEDLSVSGPLDPLSVGGIRHAIIGTLIITSLALILTVPLAVVCAVFLTESQGRMANLVRTVVTAMTALPSIVAGLFIFAVWVLWLGYDRSGTAAAIAISIMMLPIIVRSADVVLRLVPGNLREASSALGAPQWRTVWHVVLPTARSGLVTSVILGVARGIGETAPILLTAGYTASVNWSPSTDAMASLPLVAFNLVRSPQETQIARGFATAAVLMVLVLILFSVARTLGGKPAGQHSKRKARRMARHSHSDETRFESYRLPAAPAEAQS